ncbi:dimethylsulfonioproprionate lyase family protein [uncultured Roseibium sp.]|uniref:dimethylsulfonioproprionate lyase family protein n=1 Tax=uncultured Roseibium sp. TaxID=1936171 RepID=UPI002602A9CC|nr:dimethylsulfonioproprionate lyase family protein [uncultured Roseibium sp.]
MTGRPKPLQDFLTAALDAFSKAASEPESHSALSRIERALAEPAPVPFQDGRRLPVCDHLRLFQGQGSGRTALGGLLDRFFDLEPGLVWRGRAGDMTNASANFAEGHANAVVVGPSGMERRSDVWLGVSLLAPHVRYPNHSHPPEEIYLVASKGEFRHGGSNWFEPGPGGSFYNSPGIDHAMRSGDTPLLAFWFLCSSDAGEA